MDPPLITIDGPSGAGKTTVSRLLARRLGYKYVDTGALYRAVALAALRRKCPPDDDGQLAEICRHLLLRFETGPEGQKLYMNDVDITEQIRTQEIAALASAVSARAVVRKYLLGAQREAAKNGGVVFEGRDMGTVVFPEADVKFFLDAENETRASRRHKELVSKGQKTSLGDVAKAIRKRDEDDSSRCLAPLRAAPDAVRIDSTSLDIRQVVELMVDLIAKTLK